MNETCTQSEEQYGNLVSEFRELKTCVKESASHVQTEGEDRVKEEKDWRSHAEHLIELQEDQRKKEVDRLMLVMELTQARALQAAADKRTPKSEENSVRSDLFEASSFQFSGAKHWLSCKRDLPELKASVTDSASKVLTEGGDQVKEKKEEISLVEHLVQVQEDQGKEQVDRLKLVIEEPKILNEQDLTSSNAVKLTQCDVLQATVGDLLHESKSIDDVSKSVVDDNLKSRVSTLRSCLTIESIFRCFPSFPALDRTWNQSRFLRQMVMRKRTTSFGSLAKDAETKSSSFPNFNFASGNKSSQDLYNEQVDGVASPIFSGFGSNINQAQNSSSLFGGNIKPAVSFGSFAKVAEAKSGGLLNIPSSSVSTFGCGTKNFQGFPNTPVNFAASPKFSGFGSNLNQAQTSSSLFGGDRKTTTSFGLSLRRLKQRVVAFSIPLRLPCQLLGVVTRNSRCSESKAGLGESVLCFAH
uniref:Uncharacterized protein n=1 Tax=Ditylenchus dipsaci TaxID=166011 RepID=A0A915DSR5_9BILA